MNEAYNQDNYRQPTEHAYKNRILIKLDEISKLYEYTNIQIQVSQYHGTVTQEMLTGLIKYTSKIITVYKMLKPKIEYAEKKNAEIEELRIIDEYMVLMDEIKANFDVQKAFTLFTLFSYWEDLLRSMCEILGYTSDKAKL